MYIFQYYNNTVKAYFTSTYLFMHINKIVAHCMHCAATSITFFALGLDLNENTVSSRHPPSEILSSGVPVGQCYLRMIYTLSNFIFHCLLCLLRENAPGQYVFVVGLL